VAEQLVAAEGQNLPAQGTDPEGESRAGSRPRSEWRRSWSVFATNRLAVAGLVGLTILLVVAIVGPLVYTQSATDADIFNLMLNAWPSAAHPLGTDKDGVDILARLLAGLRVSLAVALFAEMLNILIGVPIGLAAGYFGGALDFLLSRVADVLFAFPGLLLAILVAGVFGASIGDAAGGLGRLALVIISLALVSWPLLARYVRAEVLSLRERDYVESARAVGAPTSRIVLAHIAPNVVGLVLTATTLDMASVVVNEAVLSLLGLGVQPPHSSIGIMISAAITVLNINWTESLFPGLVLTLMVLCFSFVGDGLYDALDPRSLR
jgi:ABC-type dipeptide/oligopeptide/nickel transport system permease subunit